MLLTVLGFGLTCCLAPAAAPAREGAAPSVESLKLSYLLKFPEFVTWPKNAFANAKAPLVIGVWRGEMPVPEELRAVIEKEKYGTRPTKFREVKEWNEAQGCHLLYLPGGPQAPPPDSVFRQPLLIVSGGALTVLEASITFAREDNRLRFDINVPAAKAAGLVIDGRLLKLARRVKLAGDKEGDR